MNKSEKRPLGRPTKYTPDRVEKILRIIRDGNYRNVAAQCAGISTETFYQWMDSYPDFSDAIIKAEADCEAEVVARFRNAGQMDWRASESYLKRKHPERWGDKSRVEQTGADGGPIQIITTELGMDKLTNDELTEKLETACRAIADGGV